jgi:riboflavin kinase/FMN adenylyltransferase
MPINKDSIISGIVVRGIKKGSEIGYPTINIQLRDPDPQIEFGIYTCYIFFENEKYNGVMHYGNKTIGTEDKKKIFCEVHIFDFSKDVYGKEARVQLLKKIRNVREFRSDLALQKQIEEDIEAANQYFKND